MPTKINMYETTVQEYLIYKSEYDVLSSLINEL